ncbi:MAG: hypothetical protein QOH49_431 [Acidobacteriota bacterium]|nr:hypothetical protein [Acidobacteriota bacterium]
MSVNIFVRKRGEKGTAKIFYARTDEFWRKGEKYEFLDKAQHVGGVEWQELQPDEKHNWLTEGMRIEYPSFIPIGTKETNQAKGADAETVFKNFGLGIKTARDSVVYNFDPGALLGTVERFCDDYNAEVFRYKQKGRPTNIDDFLSYTKIKWSRNLKRDLRNDKLL